MKRIEARTTSEILKAVAYHQWHEVYKKEVPPNRVPTETDLYDWITSDKIDPDLHPDQIPASFDPQHPQRVWRLDDHSLACWGGYDEEEIDGDSQSGLLASLRARTNEPPPLTYEGLEIKIPLSAWQDALDHVPPDAEIPNTLPPSFGKQIYLAWSSSPVDTISQGIEQLHANWLETPEVERRSHPLEDLVRAWQEWKDQQVLADRRRNGILPNSMRNAEQRKLFNELPQCLDRQTPLGILSKSIQDYLPGFEPEPSKSSIIPTLPIALYIVAGGKLTTRGQGAPITQRLLFEALMSVPRGDRFHTQQPEITLRDLVQWIWPNGWQRGRDLPKLQKALWELDNLRIHYDRALWRLIEVDRLPASDASLDDPVKLYIKHLPDSTRGPLIDRHQLRLFGLQSAPAWRSFLRLAYIWDEAKRNNNGYRIYATRPVVKRGHRGVLLDENNKPILKKNGAPVTNWNDKRAVRLHDAHGKPLMERQPQADKVPTLNLDELAQLGFDDKPTDNADRRFRAKATRAALTNMEKQGAIVLEKNGKNEDWRILEPAPKAVE